MNRSRLTFRAAVPADIGPIVALVNSAYRGESSRRGWTTEADLLGGQRTDADEIAQLIAAEGSTIRLCFDGAALVASVHLQRDEQAAYLGMLAIEPARQGQGIGKYFMEEAERFVRIHWGVTVMRMLVITRRTELIAFYQRRGYRHTGTFKEFPTDIRFGIPKVPDLKFELLEKDLC